MGDFLSDLISCPSRKEFFPRSIRAAYALMMKRVFNIFKIPMTCSVDGVGKMELRPWELIDSRIFFFRTWEPALTNFMKKSIKAGDVVIDVGANAGYFTLIMSKKVGESGKVYAIEPSLEIRTRLQDSLDKNNVRNVVVVPYGISDRSERRSFYLYDKNPGASKFGAVSENGLELRRLSEVIPDEDIQKVSFIKIDVEGMEGVVMKDIMNIFEILKKRITICAELRIDQEIRGILKFFQQRGFKIFEVPNLYSMVKYPRHPLDLRPVEGPPDGQVDLALIRD